MSTLAARLIPAAEARWFGLVETGLRVMLIAAAPVSAAIFVTQWF